MLGEIEGECREIDIVVVDRGDGNERKGKRISFIGKVEKKRVIVV